MLKGFFLSYFFWTVTVVAKSQDCARISIGAEDPLSIFKTRYDSLSAEQLDELRGLYANHKTYPLEMEKEILTSLSHYPELRNIRIKFCYASIFTSMKAVPSPFFIFQRKEKRTYRIVMNNRSCHGTTILQRASAQALTGVIGHELGHIKDYASLSNFGLLKLLAGYIFHKGRVATEIRADQHAIDHQLGPQLVEFSEFIMSDPYMNPKYVQYKKKYYYTPEFLRNLVKMHEVHQQLQ